MTSTETRKSSGYDTIHHFGPDPSYVGGMGSVIRILAIGRVGGDLIRIHPTWRPNALIQTLILTLRALGAVSRSGRRDVIHVHVSIQGSFIREGALVFFARKLRRTTVITIHGSSFLAFARRHPRLVSSVLRRAHLVICLDLEVVKFVEDIGAPGRVELVANPIVMDEQSGAADETNEIVLFAGEVGLRKGVDVLASAWNMVAPEHPDARLLIAGPPTDLIVSPAERLEMLGPQSPAAVRELIRQARVIALPSRAEGMPMVLTEAMSAGRPFVGTPVGAVAELAEHGGCLAAVGDDLALASRLKEFLADPGRARSVGERGRTYCAATRSVEVIDRQMRGHYAKAAELAAKS